MDDHIGTAIAGLHADSRILVDYARVQCQVHRLTYDEPVRVETITRTFCRYQTAIYATWWCPPFGSALLIVGVNPDGKPRVMTTSPSGTFWAWEGVCMGQNSDEARDKLSKELNQEMSLEEIIKLGIKILKESSEDDFAEDTVQIGLISVEERKFKILSDEEAKEYME